MSEIFSQPQMKSPTQLRNEARTRNGESELFPGSYGGDHTARPDHLLQSGRQESAGEDYERSNNANDASRLLKELENRTNEAA